MNCARWGSRCSAARAHSPHSSPSPSLTATQDLRIDATDYDLEPFRDFLVLPDGSIAVPQGTDHAVRFFDVHGKPTGSFGREGAGPGEFRVVGLFGIIGDTVWVDDGRNNRVTYIGPDHKLVRSAPLPGTIKSTPTDSIGVPSGTGGGHLFMGAEPDGSFLTYFRLPRTMPRPTWFPASASGYVWVRASIDGVFKAVIGGGPAPPNDCLYRFMSGGTELGSTWIPWCDQSLRAIASDGRRLVFVIGNDPESPPRYRVVSVGRAGDTVLDRRYPYEPVAVSQHLADSTRDINAKRSMSQPEFAGAWRHMTFPKDLPPVLRVLPGLDGSVWLEVPATDPRHHWRILDPKGNPVGVVTVPGNISIRQAEMGRFWGTDTDADGLQSMVRYRMAGGH